MKVALVIEWLDPWRGGAETSTQQFMHHLLEREVELHVYTRSRPSSTPNLKIHSVTAPSPTRAPQTALFAYRAARLIRRQKYDVVHAITPCSAADVYQPRGGTVIETLERNVALRRRASSRRVKRLANYLNLKQQIMLRQERRLLTGNRPPIVAAVSGYVARQLRDHYGYPNGRIRMIFNGVDPDTSSPVERRQDRQQIRKMYGIGNEDYLVLLIAHNFRLKGVARWIDAVKLMSSLDGPPLRSLVVGKDNPSKWQRLVDEAGLGERIHFVGPSPRPAAFRHAADVFVHPTYYDPCSRVVLEALASGLPSVTTRFDGSSEVIEHGRHGWVLDSPDDVAGLALAVTTLRDPQRRESMTKASLELGDRIDMGRHVREMWGLYHELMETRDR